MHDALADRSRVVYDPYTPEQQQGIRRQLEKFVAAQVKGETIGRRALILHHESRKNKIITRTWTLR